MDSHMKLDRQNARRKVLNQPTALGIRNSFLLQDFTEERRSSSYPINECTAPQPQADFTPLSARSQS